jgi:peroxiredoxin Q/BCP
MPCRIAPLSALLVFVHSAAAVVPGDVPPAVKAKNQDGKVVDVATMYGRRPVVLFFYPKSFTPGCTIEVQAFRDALGDLREFDAAVFGVSQDDPGTHRKFCDSYRLSYDLLADDGGAIATSFGIPTSGRFNSRHTVVVGRTGKVVFVETDVNKDIKGHPKRVAAALEKDWKAYVGGFKPLFNGKDLDGWAPVQASTDTWTVKDGVLLNGELVNEAKKANPASGFVGLQSEGVPIRFRTIGIKGLSQ